MVIGLTRWLAVAVFVPALLANGWETAAGAERATRGKREEAARPAPVLVPVAYDQLITAERVLAGPGGKVLSLAYTSDGRRLAAGGDDKAVAVWDRGASEPVWTMKELPDKVSSLCFTGDGGLLVTSGQGKEILVWEAGSGTPLAAFRVPDDVRALACGPRGRSLAAALDDRTIRLWDLSRIQAMRPEGAKQLAGKAEDWFKKLKDREMEEAGRSALVRTMETGKERSDALAFSPDGTLLAAGGRNGAVTLLDVGRGSVTRELERVEKDVRGLVFSPDGSRLAGVEDKRRLVVWELKGGGKTRVAPLGEDDVYAVALSPDGALIAAAGRKRVTLWSSATLRQFHLIDPAERETLAVAFGPDGSMLATAGEEKEVRLWKVPGIVALLAAPPADDGITALEAERDARLKALAAPRGEFETTREFEGRRKRAKSDETAIRKGYEGKIRLLAARREAEQARLKRRLYPYTLKGELGSYDADQETFSARVGDNVVGVRVPNARARELARNRDKVAVSGMLRYYSADKAELVNAALVDPQSGVRYPFGVEVAGEAPGPDTSRVASPSAPRRALPRLEIGSVSLVEPSGNGLLDAGETGVVRVSIRNRGSGPAGGVSLDIGPDRGTSLPRALTVAERTPVGDIPPGESRNVEVQIVGGEDLPTRDVRLLVTALEADGFDAQPVAIAFGSRALLPPELQLARIDLADADGRRVISKGKEVNITLSVHNAGKGSARGVIARVEAGDPNVKVFGEPEANLGSLKPGETKQAVFTVAVTQRYDGPLSLPISFSLAEERPAFGVRPAVRLTLNEEAPQVRVVKVEAKEGEGNDAEDVSEAPQFPGPKRAFTAKDLAVVVGIERYQNLPKSDYAYNDARSVKAYLLALGFAERNIELLTDERATLSAIRKSVETWLPNRVAKGARIFFYYSGHGAPDPATGDSFIVPYDGDPGYLADTGYPVKRLYEKLGSARGEEVIVVMDSCFSGMGGRSVLAKGARPLVLVGEGPVIPPGMAVLSSTQGNQISTTFPEKEHGVFTYYFLRAIKAGKQDLSGLYSFIKPQVEDAAKGQNVSQSPSLAVGKDGSARRFRLLRD
jgi:WD40 repeat protein